MKLLPVGFDQENFSGDTPYYIMFGPDVCGGSRRVHVIFHYKGTNHLIKHTIPPETDHYTHVYTLIVNPDQTYRVLIDNKEKMSGNLLEDWDFLPPKQINDPSQSKPADWVDEKEISDPSAVKPEGWDDIPKLIQDPDATQPDDWDSDLDGDWEPPFVPNPEYKGEWSAPKIPNPDYKGPWVHPQIDNPDYVEDEKIYAYKDIGGIGIEIWQVKSGTIFDNILVTNSVEEAAAAAEEALAQQEAEKELQQARDAAELAERDAERKRL
jgi:calreticulin